MAASLFQSLPASDDRQCVTMDSTWRPEETAIRDANPDHWRRTRHPLRVPGPQEGEMGLPGSAPTRRWRPMFVYASSNNAGCTPGRRPPLHRPAIGTSEKYTPSHPPAGAPAYQNLLGHACANFRDIRLAGHACAAPGHRGGLRADRARRRIAGACVAYPVTPQRGRE